MFLGHFAVAFAAKPAAPSVSLGTLFFACQWVDLMWPLFLLAGLERVEIKPGITAFTPLDFVYYPWTHSLVMGVSWAAAFGLLYLSIRGSGKAALIVAAVLLSHWFLDLVAHRPDLPLAPGSETRWGFGLWNSIPATLLVEVGAAFGPLPPSVEAIAWAGLIGGAVTGFLGYWIDRHRAMAG